jgi:hypothetical protein
MGPYVLLCRFRLQHLFVVNQQENTFVINWLTGDNIVGKQVVHSLAIFR